MSLVILTYLIFLDILARADQLQRALKRSPSRSSSGSSGTQGVTQAKKKGVDDYVAVNLHEICLKCVNMLLNARSRYVK